MPKAMFVVCSFLAGLFALAVLWSAWCAWGSFEDGRAAKHRADLAALERREAASIARAPEVVDAGPEAGGTAPTESKLARHLAAAAAAWMTLPGKVAFPPAPGTHSWEAFVAQEEETPEEVQARIAEVAGQVAAFANAEDCLWPGSPLEGPSCAETGLVLMSLAFNETRFRGYVDDGRCDDLEWRKTKQAGKLLKLGTCDYSASKHFALARSLWQLHDFDATSRPAAIAEALRRVRRSLQTTGNLAGYTGEPDPANAPKAAIRLRMAADYARRHPFAP